MPRGFLCGEPLFQNHNSNCPQDQILLNACIFLTENSQECKSGTTTLSAGDNTLFIIAKFIIELMIDSETPALSAAAVFHKSGRVGHVAPTYALPDPRLFSAICDTVRFHSRGCSHKTQCLLRTQRGGKDGTESTVWVSMGC